MTQLYRKALDDAMTRLRASRAVRGTVAKYAVLRQYPRILAVLPIVFGLAVVFAVWIGMGHWRLIHNQAFWLLTVPLFFYLFLRATDRDAGPTLYIKGSEHCAIICASGFFLSVFSGGFLQLLMLATGLSGGMFIYVDYNVLHKLVQKRIPAAIAACVGGLSGISYLWSQLMGWKTIAATTANTMYWFLFAFIEKLWIFARGQLPPRPAPLPHPHPVMPPAHPHMFHRVIPHRNIVRVPYHAQPHPLPVPTMPVHRAVQDYMALGSEHFVYRIGAIENVAAGIFAFLFLLSLEVMLSGRQVSGKRFALIAVGGTVAVFVLNALSLSLFFYLGDAALMPPHVPSLAMTIFHNIGFLFFEPWVGFTCYVLVSLAIIRLLFGKLSILAWKLPDRLKRAQ